MGLSTVNDGICPFGQALAEARKKMGIAQSRLGMKASCNPANMKLIEDGAVQPGVLLALKLVSLTGADIRNFFDQLALQAGIEVDCPKAEEWIISSLQSMLSKIVASSGTVPIIPKAMYGRLLKEVRVMNGITQKRVAKAANYNLRNILNVETKGQEPGIITAIALVAATGCPVGIFFQVLAQYINEITSN